MIIKNKVSATSKTIIAANKILSDTLFDSIPFLFNLFFMFFSALSTAHSSLGPYFVNNFLTIRVDGNTIAVNIRPIADKTVYGT